MTGRAEIRALGIAAATFAIAGPALAHPGHAGADLAGSGLLAGFLHPFTGIAHLMAAVLAGALAWRLGGHVEGGREARLMAIVAYPAAMLLGIALLAAGVLLPAVSTALVLSIAALGALLVFGSRLPVSGSVALVGLFAAVHGYAHAAAAPSGAAPATFAIGVVWATILLQGLGLKVAAASMGTRRSIGAGRRHAPPQRASTTRSSRSDRPSTRRPCNRSGSGSESRTWPWARARSKASTVHSPRVPSTLFCFSTLAARFTG